MSFNATIQVDGLDDLLRDVRRVGGNADRIMRGFLTNATNKIQSEARSRAPHKTGALQRSILPEINDLDALVAVNEKYGVWIEEGTGIYGPTGQPIRPKKAKMLVFSIGGRKIVTKSVKGTKAKPFFKPGIKAAEPYIEAQFKQMGNLIIRQMAGRS